MGVVGILPLIAEKFKITVPQAGLTVSAFALVVAIAAPVMPLLFSGINRKTAMLLALGAFAAGNLVSMFTDSYALVLVARIIPAFFHPIYVSMAFTVAASSVDKKDSPKAIAKVFVGVSAGMVLGVPVTSFIASETSFSVAMGFFALVNALAFIATLLYIPSMPVRHRPTHRSQLGVLKKPVVWYSIAAFTCLNGAMFGFFSYMSDYLKNITGLSFKTISMMLLVYGCANIVGNIAAGKLLSWNPRKSIIAIPIAMTAVYIMLFAFGESAWLMAVIILALGILAGIASNNGQFMISRAAHETPDFANGLFLTSANFGTTIGTAVCGLFISGISAQYSVMGAFVFLAAAIAFIVLRETSITNAERETV